MISLIDIDRKLQASFINIKKDMESFRKQLKQCSERISVLENNDQKSISKELTKLSERLSAIEDSKDNKELKELRKELKTLDKDFEKLHDTQEKEFKQFTEKLQNLRDDVVFKEELDDLYDEIDSIKKNVDKPAEKIIIKEKPKKEKKEKPKKEETKEDAKEPKKKIFDKVIDFFAEED